MIKVEIKELKKTKNKYIVLVDDQKLSISEEAILKFQIYQGKELSSTELKQMMEFENTTNIFNKILNFLSFKERSTSEVKEYLTKKEVNYAEIVQIIRKLEDLQYLNDEIYVNHAIESYSRSLKGKNYIKHKLLEKGISKSLIDQSFENYGDDQELDSIHTLVSKELPKINIYPINKQKQMLIQKLARDGFQNGLISKVIHSIEITSNHHETLKKEYEKLLRKHKDKDTKTSKNKIIQSLMQKGYSYQDIIALNSEEEI